MAKRERASAPEQGSKQKENFGRPVHEQLVKGISHPVRAACLTLLAERVASPREIAEGLDEDLSNVSYHVRVLCELGLIELVHEESVRGAVAHYYKAVERPLFSNEQWEKMPLGVRKAFSAHNWDILLQNVTLAIAQGTFDSRPDRHLTRTPLVVDSQGFARLSKAMDDLLEVIFNESVESAERLRESGEEGIHAVAGTALFAMPKPKQGPGAAHAA
jgi:DNA-binding transcriptional ArsR family regulator